MNGSGFDMLLFPNHPWCLLPILRIEHVPSEDLAEDPGQH